MADGTTLAPPVRAYPSDAVRDVDRALEALRVELLSLHPIPPTATDAERAVIGETHATINRQIADARHTCGVALVRAMRGTREGK